MSNINQRWSLRRTVNIGVAVFLLPMLFVVGISSLLFRVQIKDGVVTSVDKNIDITSRLYIDNYFVNIEQQFETLFERVSKEPEVFLSGSQVSIAITEQLLKNIPEAKDAGIVFSDGRYRYIPTKKVRSSNTDLRAGNPYQKAIDNPGEIIWSDPITSSLDNDQQKKIIVLAKAIYDESTGETKAVVTLAISLDRLLRQFNRIGLPSGGVFTLINENNKVVIHSNSELIGQDFFKANDYLKGVLQGRGNFIYPNGDKRGYFYHLERHNWYVLIAYPISLEDSQIARAYKLVFPFLIAAAFVFYAMIALLSNLFINSLIEEIVKLVRAMRNNTLSENDISIKEIALVYHELYGVHQHIQETHKQSRMDKLTSLYNRRAFDEMVQLLQTQGDSYQIAIIDIDNFKKVNDVYGHAVGDVVLRRVAKSGLKVFATHENCTIYRYGGEELVVIAIGMDIEPFTHLMQEWRNNIDAMEWREVALHVTFSGGLTTINEFEKGEEGLIRADQALYQAKAQGKNRLICA